VLTPRCRRRDEHVEKRALMFPPDSVFRLLPASPFDR
jgi:hypothetical protein